ncbi:MAG: SUF system NifU family Fe-S cluster assembly protein [Puniceicoccales bacterium]|jgi:nitrogen fixation NifU-like protein|nr:SUF system NifU family Fe-S cluster assembly protein [Puniceicoccales bacterium]
MDHTLVELYQEIILEHNRAPRNRGKLVAPAKSSRGHNPSCGDDITVFVEIENDTIRKITFDGEGCAISQASASLMTELLLGKSRTEANKIIDEICSTLSDPNADSEHGNLLADYGDVASLVGVKSFPMRIKCATLSWHAAKGAIS